MKRNAIISLGLLVFVALLQVVHAQTYTYDLGGRLTSATYTNGTQVLYSYDPAGNIAAIATNSVTQTTNLPIATISTPAVSNNPTAPTSSYMFSFTWSCIPGLNYEVLFSPDLNSTNWTILSGPMAATNCTISTSDLISTNSQRFYRVILLP